MPDSSAGDTRRNFARVLLQRLRQRQDAVDLVIAEFRIVCFFDGGGALKPAPFSIAVFARPVSVSTMRTIRYSSGNVEKRTMLFG